MAKKKAKKNSTKAVAGRIAGIEASRKGFNAAEKATKDAKWYIPSFARDAIASLSKGTKKKEKRIKEIQGKSK